MYFTDTPSLGSVEAIMKRPPGVSQRGGGKNRSPYRYTKDDCDCRLCLHYRKRTAVPQRYARFWISGLSVAGLLSVRPSNPPLPGRGTFRSKNGSQNYMTERMLNT